MGCMWSRVRLYNSVMTILLEFVSGFDGAGCPEPCNTRKWICTTIWRSWEVNPSLVKLLMRTRFWSWPWSQPVMQEWKRGVVRRPFQVTCDGGYEDGGGRRGEDEQLGITGRICRIVWWVGYAGKGEWQVSVRLTRFLAWATAWFQSLRWRKTQAIILLCLSPCWFHIPCRFLSMASKPSPI